MSLRRCWSWVLAWALLAAHTLGAVHGIAHARLAGTFATAQGTAATATAGGLFKHDDGGSCRLFDQLSHGDSVPTAAVAFAPVAPTAQCSAQGVAVERGTALASRARGPPVLA